MKKHSILFLALLAAVSCQKENTQDIAPVFDSNVELRASFDEQSSRIATEDGLTFSLEEGKEQIGVYINLGDTPMYDNVLYTAGSADEQGWISFSTDVLVHVQSNSKFFAYAPYNATTVDVSGSTDGGSTDDGAIEPAAAVSGWNGKRAINLPDLQEQPAAGVKTDIAKYYSVVAVPAIPVARDVLDAYSVNLQFSGIFALVRFGLNNFTEGEIKVSKLVFSAENAALTGYFSVDLTHENPKLSNTEYAPEAIAGKTFDKVTVTLAEPATIAAQEMAEVYAVVNACAVTAPKLTVYATDAEGKDIVFEKTLSDKTFSRQQRTAIGVKLENPVYEEAGPVICNGESYETIADAVAANADATEITLKAGTFTLPNDLKNLTINGREGTEINIKNANPSNHSRYSDVVFNNITFNAGQENYHGFQHAGNITFNKCTINGLLFGYGSHEIYNECVFNNPTGEYCMWTYGANADYIGCVFNGAGKLLHIYNEGLDLLTINIKDCKFVSTAKNKAAVNVKSANGTKHLQFNVNIDNCTVEGEFPEANGGLWACDDKFFDSVSIKVDGTEVYKKDPGYKEVDGGYEVYSAQGMQWLAEQVNGGNNFSGKTVTLTADIDLENADWTPIGTKGNPFAGKFDGGSKTISNLNVNSPEEAFKGLFGRLVEPGTISNININNAVVKGYDEVGAIVGSAYTGSVSNCHVSGDIVIEGHYHVGGITGYGYAPISGCSVIGNAGSYVKGTYKENNFEGDAVGGIIGYAAEKGNAEAKVISECSATIDVIGTRKVGGIAGQCGKDANVYGCTFSGNVSIEAPESYITGNSGKIMIGGIVGELTGTTLFIKNSTIAEGSTVTGVDAKTTGAILGGSRTAGYTLNEENNTATGVTVTPSNELPEGIVKTETGYEIQSATGLSNLAALVNEGKDFAGETIVLADNMNLEGIAWTPIGNCSRKNTSGAAFRGTFDGNGKVISNLNCALDADNFGAGLFGLLDGATVRNVTIDSGEISNSADCAGAICGVMVGESVIENCHNTGATISAKGAAGGIVGRAYGASNTITGCTNSAQVSGTQKVGGIVGITGTNGTTLIDNCDNSGSVSGGNAGVGGIAGYVGQPTTVKNCTNTGTIGTATDKYAAGIVGYHQTTPSCDIENCNNEGAVTAINAGGIFGCVGSTQATNISGCENRGDVTGVNIAGGISAGAASGTLENCKNTANITASAEGGIAGGIAGQYRNAAIVNCAGGAASAAVTAQYAGRIIGLALNGTVFANNMPEDARLTLDDSNGDDYSGISSIGAMGMYTSGGSIIIAGGTLHGLPVQAVELSHIRIEEGAAWDVYPNETGIWTSDKTHPWGREGLTETTDGYDLTNTYGILHFAQMVNNGVSTFSGKTILLKNNIDLDGIEWTPIGTEGKPFCGNFDGNGKTISNLQIDKGSMNDVGLFGYAGKVETEIHNFTINNATVKGSWHTAVVCGNPYASVKLYDIDVTGHVELNGHTYVGTISGYGYNEIDNCKVQTDDSSYVKASYIYAGGICGFRGEGNGNTTYSISNCNSNIDVTGLSYVGGITGICHYGNTIDNCHVTANITETISDGADESDKNGIGGIAGITVSDASLKCTIKGCSFTGSLTTNYNINHDGIVGGDKSGNVQQSNLVLENNTSNVTNR